MAEQELTVQYQDGGFPSAARPVAPGDTVSLYLTGLGAMSQTFPDGAAPGTTAAALQQPQILVEGTAAVVAVCGSPTAIPGAG